MVFNLQYPRNSWIFSIVWRTGGYGQSQDFGLQRTIIDTLSVQKNSSGTIIKLKILFCSVSAGYVLQDWQEQGWHHRRQRTEDCSQQPLLPPFSSCRQSHDRAVHSREMQLRSFLRQVRRVRDRLTLSSILQEQALPSLRLGEVESLGS